MNVFVNQSRGAALHRGHFGGLASPHPTYNQFRAGYRGWQGIKSQLQPLTNMKIAQNLDKIGSFGAVAVAAMAPCCFPLLGIIGTALGLGAMERFAPQLQYAVQLLVVIAWIGAFIAYREHRSIPLLALATTATALCFAHYYFYFSEPMIYSAFAALVASGIWNTIVRMKKTPANTVLESTITCPHCSHQETTTMPTDACRFLWDCPQCGEKLKPKQGDCCVFCTYGSVPCPPIQLESGCCA